MSKQRERITTLIEALPDSALDELIETLGELQACYGAVDSYAQESTEQTKSYEVTYNKPVMRAEFPIPEDYGDE